MIYNKENVKKLITDDMWKSYKKKVTTKAIRCRGKFIVETSEGTMTCEDGYLAMDARGYPYPIATKEFKLIYDEVKED